MASKDRQTLSGDINSHFSNGSNVATDIVESAVFPEDIPMWGKDKPVLVVIAGQSNAAGSNSGGPNPANPKVKVWDASAQSWGSSDYTQHPLSAGAPNGNGGNNNIGLSLAHRYVDDFDRNVFVVLDAASGISIDEWIASGINSPRYAALKSKIEAALATPEFAGHPLPEIAFCWAQGEADYLDDEATYAGKFKTLVAQLRAETWFRPNTAILFAEMAPLHDRYGPQAAVRRLSNFEDAWIQPVNSAGLQTSDSTHWTGTSLWEFGYERMWVGYCSAPRVNVSPAPVFYAREGGPAGPDHSIVVCAFDSLISAQADANNVSTGTIAWGFEVSVDGNYSVGFGYQNTIANLANYDFVSGRDCHATDNADYGFASGYQCTIDADYTFASGRGHTVVDDGGFAAGMFSEYTTNAADPVAFQIGIGTSNGNRKNGLTVMKSGQVETKNLPVHANESAASAAGLTSGQWYRTSGGSLRIKV